MNQDLEALIKAYLALGECDRQQRDYLQADYDGRLEEALKNAPASRVKCLRKLFAAVPMPS